MFDNIFFCRKKINFSLFLKIENKKVSKLSTKIYITPNKREKLQRD